MFALARDLNPVPVISAIGAAPDTSLTGSQTVAAALASTIANAGTALQTKNLLGCPAKPYPGGMIRSRRA